MFECENKVQISDESYEKEYEHSDILKFFIFSNVCIGLTRNDKMKAEVDNIYKLDRFKYYNAAMDCKAIRHIILTQGSLEQEIYSRKILGMLLIAEEDLNLRNKIIKLLRKHYPWIYKAVKQASSKELAKRYLEMDKLRTRTERRIYSGIYMYLLKYSSEKNIEKAYVFSIMNDINKYNLYSPMLTDIEAEIKKHKDEINKIKALIKEKYGEIQCYRDVLNIEDEYVENLGAVVENYFIINKIDIDQIFYNSKLPNMDYIILAYIKRGYKSIELEVVVQSIVVCIFLKYMFDEYRKSKKLFLENNQEELIFKTSSLEDKLKAIENENNKMKIELELLKKKELEFDEVLKTEVNRLNKEHELEIFNKDKMIKFLEKRVEDAEVYKNELNILREYVFQVKNEYIPKETNDNLERYLVDKKIVIVGGVKEWRRRFKEKYTQVQMLNGFNDNFEIGMISNADYIFFYTGFMSHSTYNRIMNYVRTKQISFGYIGKTNMELVEAEIIEELKKCSIGRRINI
jgi:hypothetical protein